MQLSQFLQQLKEGAAVSFQETIAVISAHYDYQPTAFSNGLAQPVISEAGRNEGSCKIFAFARLHDLSEAQTLALFGDYYHHDVLNNPQGDDHQNIRRFMQDGWAGIVFQGTPLVLRRADAD